MPKPKRVKNDFKYKRVELVRGSETSEDSEDDLDRILGPSANAKSAKRSRRSSKCGTFCGLLSLMLVIGTFAIVLVFGTVVYPGSIQDALRKYQVFETWNETFHDNTDTVDNQTILVNKTSTSHPTTEITAIPEIETATEPEIKAPEPDITEKKARNDYQRFRQEQAEAEEAFRQNGFDFHPVGPDFRSDEKFEEKRQSSYPETEERSAYPETEVSEPYEDEEQHLYPSNDDYFYYVSSGNTPDLLRPAVTKEDRKESVEFFKEDKIDDKKEDNNTSDLRETLEEKEEKTSEEKEEKTSEEKEEKTSEEKEESSESKIDGVSKNDTLLETPTYNITEGTWPKQIWVNKV